MYVSTCQILLTSELQREEAVPGSKYIIQIGSACLIVIFVVETCVRKCSSTCATVRRPVLAFVQSDKPVLYCWWVYEVVCHWTSRREHSRRRKHRTPLNSSLDLFAEWLLVPGEKFDIERFGSKERAFTIQRTEPVGWNCWLTPSARTVFTAAKPKSPIFTRQFTPASSGSAEVSRKTLLDFKSRWMISRSCRYLIKRKTTHPFPVSTSRKRTHDSPWHICRAMSISWLIFQCRSSRWMCLNSVEPWQRHIQSVNEIDVWSYLTPLRDNGESRGNNVPVEVQSVLMRDFSREEKERDKAVDDGHVKRTSMRKLRCEMLGTDWVLGRWNSILSKRLDLETKGKAFNRCPFTFECLTVQSHFCFVDRTIGAPTDHPSSAEQIFGSNFPLTDMFLQKGSIHISDESVHGSSHSRFEVFSRLFLHPCPVWSYLVEDFQDSPALIHCSLDGKHTRWDSVRERTKVKVIINERERERARRSISFKQKRQRWRRSASKLYR